MEHDAIFVKEPVLCGLVSLLTVAALGQRETGQISGTITDPVVLPLAVQK